MRPKLLLLLGPAGAGKSTVIWHLKQLDARFLYISPYITRELRPGEVDKIYVSLEHFDELEQAGQFLVVNELYGAKYGTPRSAIESALASELFPLVDWPIGRLEIMKQSLPGLLFVAYLEPPNAEELQARLLERNAEGDASRQKEALGELARLRRGDWDNDLDLRIVNRKGSAAAAAVAIYERYLATVSSIAASGG